MPKPSIGADSTRRAARTLFQIGTVTALIQVWNLFSARPLTADQTSAITVVGTLLITFFQNLLEEQGSVPEMLKGDPVVDLTARKLDALATATGAQQDEIERLEDTLRDIRADMNSGPERYEDIAAIRRAARDPDPEDSEPIATHTPGAPWPPGGMG